MLSYFTLTLFLLPINQEIKFTDSLTLEVPYLKERERASFAGFLLSKAKMAQLMTEISSAEEFCEVRRRSDADQFSIDLKRVQDDFTSRTKGYLLRISNLENQSKNLAVSLKAVGGELNSERDEYRLFRYLSYGVGGTLVGIITYLIVR